MTTAITCKGKAIHKNFAVKQNKKLYNVTAAVKKILYFVSVVQMFIFFSELYCYWHDKLLCKLVNHVPHNVFKRGS